jgi:chromosome segregation protein
MKVLDSVHLVQFSFWEYETFELSKGGTAFIGPNGAGKTSLVDAIQIAIVGANRNYLQFNAQSVHKDARSLRDYALGTMRSGEGEKGAIARKRDQALSYISMVFEDEDSHEVISAGLAIASNVNDPQAHVLGMYVLPGVRLTLEHHLEDLGGEGKAPQDWKVFEALIRSLSSGVGRTPTITAKPETYLDELLHNLADSKQVIDPRKFLKALKQSIKLKDVNSVSDFLRDNLVDATRIDKRGTLLHIQTLRRLSAQIEEVVQQLAELDAIANRHRSLELQHRRKATLHAVSLQLEVEAVDAALATLQAKEGELGQKIEAIKESIELKKTEVETTFKAYEDLQAAIQSDPDAAIPEQARRLLEAKKGATVSARREVDLLESRVGDALHSAALAFDGRYVADAQGLAQASRIWEARRSRQELASLGQMKESLQLLQRTRTAVEQLEFDDRDELRRAAKLKSEAEEKLKAARDGVRVRDNDVAATLKLFSDAGIRCHTVASVVSVSDVSWQGAIETFLGRNRHAIVVERGRERDAVALIRRSEINDVTVVQPNHIRDSIGRPAERGTAADLLNSQDEIALAYLTRILGKMRCVESEAELEEHSRALTKDCMLSANGGTRRMRPLPVSDWILGVQISSTDKAELLDEWQNARKSEQDAKRLAGLSQHAKESVALALKEVTLDRFSAALTGYQASVDAEAAASDPKAMELPERLQKLKEQANEARQRHTDAQEVVVKANGELGTLTNELGTTREKLLEVEAELGRLQAACSDSVNHPDYDSEIAETHLASAYQAGDAMRSAVIESFRGDISKIEALINKTIPDIASTFTEYINRHSIGLVEERSDWRKAAVWVNGHMAKLRNSTLEQYRADAVAAREAAEKAFEADVKYSLREALRRVEREIRDLNAILDRCPPFTNGERYRFSAKIDEQHRALYNLIMFQPSEGETSQLFDDNEVQSKLVKLLEAAELGADKGNNPLEDYRLFYQFDLEIQVDGKVVDLLSKRMGVASNGEHRVPFYVIAGAALATAYRIKPGEKQRSAGVMILDEAFYGIDAQNTVVTAEFLKSLGLQLVMAGPDSDTSKLTAVLDSYYDLTRFGPDVFVEKIVVKEAARQLMQSDMPERNPHLIERKVAQLSLEAK